MTVRNFPVCHLMPVHFTNIQTKPSAEYNAVDTRPLPEQEDITDGCLHRGLLVNNIENE